MISSDGLNDCEDPDCCISISCKDAFHCVTAPDPMEILLRKQPPSSTASFYDRMRFLVEDESVQSYATLTSFNQRLVSLYNTLMSFNQRLVSLYNVWLYSSRGWERSELCQADVLYINWRRKNTLWLSFGMLLANKIIWLYYIKKITWITI